MATKVQCSSQVTTCGVLQPVILLLPTILVISHIPHKLFASCSGSRAKQQHGMKAQVEDATAAGASAWVRLKVLQDGERIAVGVSDSLWPCPMQPANLFVQAPA